VSQTDFSSLKLNPDLLRNIESLEYKEMTPIQAQSLPLILEGKDVIGQGKTGSGKTAAFGLGILSKLNIKDRRVQSLVLCPTRELADQVAAAIRQLARTLPNVKVLPLCGGMQFRTQATSLSHGAHIVVGTPGRIAKHLRKGTLKLNALHLLVLDEGDRMLDMGFQDEIDDIVSQAPTRRQTLLFSATYPERIESIAKRVMIDPVMVEVVSTHDECSIKQHFYKVENNSDERMTAVRRLIMQHRPESTVVFCNTKQDTMDVADHLIAHGFSALDLHGDLEQRDRDETLIRFSNKSISVLVATDVAARGLDIDSLDAVINYHISRDFEVHVHRIGRTGRAGSKGIACSLFSEKEHYKMSQLEEYLKIKVEGEALPPMDVLGGPEIVAPMSTILLNIGKKQKVRPGNIMGALTGKTGVAGDKVGKILVGDNWTYAAVSIDSIDHALKKVNSETWKNRPIKARLVQEYPDTSN